MYISFNIGSERHKGIFMRLIGRRTLSKGIIIRGMGIIRWDNTNIRQDNTNIRMSFRKELISNLRGLGMAVR